MKRLSLVFIVIWLLCSNLSAFAVLTVEDLDKIREIVNESEVRLEKRIMRHITEVEKRLSGDIQALDKRLSGDIQALDERLSGDIQAFDKNFGERLTFHSSLIVALIASIIGFVAVPMGFITYQYIKMRSQQDEEIKVLREKIETLETQVLVENQD